MHGPVRLLWAEGSSGSLRGLSSLEVQGLCGTPFSFNESTQSHKGPSGAPGMDLTAAAGVHLLQIQGNKWSSDVEQVEFKQSRE